MRERSGPDRATVAGGGLRDLLRRIDGLPFSRYRQLMGRHALGDFEICVDRVPPDPFAGAARLRLIVDRKSASLPADLVSDRTRRLGVEDYLSRRAVAAMEEQLGVQRPAAPGTGRVFVEPFGPAMIERSSCRITEEEIELRLLVDLPAGGRRIRGREAETLLCEKLLRLAMSVLLFSERKVQEAGRAARTAEDHRSLQRQLADRGLVAFVAEGSLLARAGGQDAGPRRDGREVAFVPPRELRVVFDLPHAGEVAGMGIPRGVTLIVGGAFHGKSTLLDAVAAGVHAHHPGDGREQVATLPEAVVVRAEDGRSVRSVDISDFLGELPSGALASSFTTEKASGSTSQASAIAEALEVGARLLLLDEDRCATNFMVRDGRMQRLVPRPAEPIVPFLDGVRELHERLGVSTLLVTGGSGDYLEVADRVIRMEHYRPRDVSEEARKIVAETRSMRLEEKIPPLVGFVPREPRFPGVSRPRSLRTGLRGPRGLRVGDETIDLAALEQLAEPGQLRAMGRLLARAVERMGPGRSVEDLVRELDALLESSGLDALDAPVAYDLSRPRTFELAALLNRWRALEFGQSRRET